MGDTQNINDLLADIKKHTARLEKIQTNAVAASNKLHQDMLNLGADLRDLKNALTTIFDPSKIGAKDASSVPDELKGGGGGSVVNAINILNQSIHASNLDSRRDANDTNIKLSTIAQVIAVTGRLNRDANTSALKDLMVSNIMNSQLIFKADALMYNDLSKIINTAGFGGGGGGGGSGGSGGSGGGVVGSGSIVSAISILNQNLMDWHSLYSELLLLNIEILVNVLEILEKIIDSLQSIDIIELNVSLGEKLDFIYDILVDIFNKSRNCYGFK